MYSLHSLKTGLPQCTKETPFICIQHYKIGKRGRGWGQGGASSFKLLLQPRQSSTPSWSRTANHTCRIRRGNGLFGNYVWNGEMKIKLHTSANFPIVTCNLLTWSSTSSCCWRDASETQQRCARWAAGKQGVTLPPWYVFLNIKLWWKPLWESCSVAWEAWGQRGCRLLLEVLPDRTM